MLVDKESSINFLILEIHNKVGLGDKIVVVLGTVNLPLLLRDEKHKREVYAKCAMVDISLVYNVILGRPVLNCHGIVINMDFLCLKLPAPEGVAIVRVSQKLAQEC